MVFFYRFWMLCSFCRIKLYMAMLPCKTLDIRSNSCLTDKARDNQPIEVFVLHPVREYIVRCLELSLMKVFLGLWLIINAIET